MKKMSLILLTLSLMICANSAQAADEKSKTKKPPVTVEETHPDRDHTVEADDVDVKRDKTVYASSTSAYSMNLRMDPLSLLVGIANVDMDFKLSKSITLGPTLAYLNRTVGTLKSTAYSVGIRMNFYPGGEALESHGWYIGPSLKYVTAKAEVGTKSAELSGGSLTTVGGYHWMWDSFNLMVGGGFVATSFPNKVTVKDSSNGTQEEVSVSAIGTGATIEATLGFAF